MRFFDKRMKQFRAIVFLLSLGVSLTAQIIKPTNGVRDLRHIPIAFTNATIVASAEKKLDNATMVILDDRIVALGTDITLPNDAKIIDLQGKYIYPSFIDLYTDYGLPDPRAPGKSPKLLPQMLSNKKGPFSWNEALKPEYHAIDHWTKEKKDANKLLKHGFGVVISHQPDGICRGTGALISLGDHDERRSVLVPKIAQVLSFSKGKSTQTYPTSLMGSIALLRQTYLDGRWYKSGGHQEERNLSLEAWNQNQNLVQIFATSYLLDVFRAQKIADEFDTQYIFKGSGDEYRRLDALKKLNPKIIIPIAFPDALDVSDPLDAKQASLVEMLHWQNAPQNPRLLQEAGIDFALTQYQNKDFRKNLLIAIEYGLSKESALRALTDTPARWIGQQNQIGSIAKGKLANFFISDGDYFEKDSKILEHWTLGKPVKFKSKVKLKTGHYNLLIDDMAYKMKVKDNNKCAIEKPDSTKINIDVHVKGQLISLSFPMDKDQNNFFSLSGIIKQNEWSGTGTDPSGRWITWRARHTKDLKNTKKETKTPKAEIPRPIIPYPFLPYGWLNKPKQESYLIKNATLWTNEDKGIIQNSDILLVDGKIAKIGRNLSHPTAKVIDATGKHVSSGIIDEHTHIAISRGVNEGSQASSAEVSIADVVNSEDINIYRQLAGGVTAAQLLHGSANPIGGQSAIIKFRWGALPEEMKIKNADGFIKFALGENVKQVNWGDKFRKRFPQTRMGVEQVFVDMFTRAREYAKAKKTKKNLRKDLELETLLQILNKKRFITCHSYQQGEINMLMKVAEKFGFRINTFTHILEGYKVADKMKAHGVGASTFSDWWAYKYEVIDAIPHNSTIMDKIGLTVAINSDDAEMARRLNQEAAKSVMYGGSTEEEAWKMVTLNPAKLLHLDHRMGSLKVGKDADVVIWSDNPLSIYARAEKTFVDGRLLYDIEQDQEKRKWIKSTRAKLIQKLLKAKKSGAKTKKPTKKEKHLYHCDSLDEQETNH